jgi:hypothetical protein
VDALKRISERVDEPHLLIHGGATGADTLAGYAAETLDVSFGATWGVVKYRADWKKHGKAAGFKRNQQMLDEGKPDLVIAFPGGKGTADMVRRAEAAGVRVERVEG